MMPDDLLKPLSWDENRAQRSAQEMYRRIFEMKFLPLTNALSGAR